MCFNFLCYWTTSVILLRFCSSLIFLFFKNRLVWISLKKVQIAWKPLDVFICTEGKRHFAHTQEGFFTLLFPRGERERERGGVRGEKKNPVLCLSQSRIGSDHWQIKALPDTSFPIAEGSWRAAGNLKRPSVGGGERRERCEGGRERGWRSEGRRRGVRVKVKTRRSGQEADAN